MHPQVAPRTVVSEQGICSRFGDQLWIDGTPRRVLVVSPLDEALYSGHCRRYLTQLLTTPCSYGAGGGRTFDAAVIPAKLESQPLPELMWRAYAKSVGEVCAVHASPQYAQDIPAWDVTAVGGLRWQPNDTAAHLK